jgi:hypothetical protein
MARATTKTEGVRAEAHSRAVAILKAFVFLCLVLGRAKVILLASQTQLYTFHAPKARHFATG